MKLASLKSRSRDGDLIIVNKELTKAVNAKSIAPTLQYALDNWKIVSPQLEEKYSLLCTGQVKDWFDFDTSKLTSPLPRSYQWADGSAYVNHVELVRKARGATMPENFWTEPLIYQGGSDSFIGPNDDILVENSEWGVDFEAEVVVITSDVPMGVTIDDAKDYIKLVGLVNDVSLRNLIPNEIGKGFGFFQSKPASAFSPVFVTIDELEDNWDGGKINLPLYSYLNGKLFGKPNAGVDMTFEFPQLISHAAKTRFLNAGTIIGSGTVSNLDRSNGSSCIAEKRMLEKIDTGNITTQFMQYNDTIKIEMLDKNQNNIFGAIEQKVTKYNYSSNINPKVKSA